MRQPFDPLERVAEQLAPTDPAPDEMYMMLKARLHEKHGISVTTLPIEEMKDALRIHDVEGKALHLSEALDYPNRTFQMAHVLCLWNLRHPESITEDSSLTTKRSIDRCHIELANYFAAALLMPYDRFLDVAEQSHYDINRLASAFRYPSNRSPAADDIEPRHATRCSIFFLKSTGPAMSQRGSTQHLHHCRIWRVLPGLEPPPPSGRLA